MSEITRFATKKHHQDGSSLGIYGATLFPVCIEETTETKASVQASCFNTEMIVQELCVVSPVFHQILSYHVDTIESRAYQIVLRQ